MSIGTKPNGRAGEVEANTEKLLVAGDTKSGSATMDPASFPNACRMVEHAST